VSPLPVDLGGGLLLRLYTMADLEDVWAVIEAERDRLEPFMPLISLVRTIEEEREWFARVTADEGSLDGCGIFGGTEFVGGAGLITSDPWSISGELGYWLRSAYEGRGIVTRACEALMRIGFDELGLHRIQLRAVPENTRSRAVAARLGMGFEGILREAARTSLGYVDFVVYAILEDEWRARA
jgi:ribosomal-protein-serine acetyltransferase